MDDQDVIREFLIESNENLARLDQEMVELEKRPQDPQLLGSIFRTIHTIKGTCGFLGFSTLESVTHLAENILSQLRDGKRQLTPELVTLILDTVDAVKTVLVAIEANGREGPDAYAELRKRLQAACTQTTVGAPAADSPTAAPDTEKAAAPKGPSVSDSSIRVDVVLLDKLMNLVGELVLARNQILQFTAHQEDSPLNATSQRRLAVLKPIKLVLTNLAAGEVIECDATNDPQNETPTTRKIVLTREVFIESDDFAEIPPPKYFRLKPGGEVRLKYACIIKCDAVVKDVTGAITELRCTADLTTRSGGPNSDKKVKGTIHWVSATHCVDAEVRLYDRLFNVPEPGAEEDLLKVVNPHSLEVVAAKLESSLATATPADRFQFERLGYFALDPLDTMPDKPVFNRTITLKDTWVKK